jgi:hypothetical protein
MAASHEAQQFFARKSLEYPVGTAPRQLAEALSIDGLTPDVRRGILERHGFENNSDLLKITLDWLLEYVRDILAASPLDADVADEIAPIKHALAIREGEFFAYRAAEVKGILLEQLELVLEDGILDDREELAQSVLQRAFDLGYDHYLRLTRPRYEIALDEARLALERAHPDDLPRLERRLLTLRSICELAVVQPRSPGGLK